MTRPDIDADWIPEEPTPFLVVRRTASPQEVREARREWMQTIMRYEAFWAARENDPGDEPAWFRFWCGKCGKRDLHDVNAHGPIATCPGCGRRIDLRPQAAFGGED